MLKRFAVIAAAIALAAGALVSSPASAAVGTSDAPCPPNGPIVLGNETVPSVGVSEFKIRRGLPIKASHNTLIEDRIGCLYTMAYPSIKLSKVKKNGVVTFKWTKAPGIKITTIEVKFLNPVTGKSYKGTLPIKTKKLSKNTKKWHTFNVNGHKVRGVLARVSFIYYDSTHRTTVSDDPGYEAYPDPPTA